MARCLELADYSIEPGRPLCLLTLEAWNTESLGAFRRIIVASFPDCGFIIQTRASAGGFLALQQRLVLAGMPPKGGVEEIGDFLSLLVGCLTIEDTLDESHSLAYHQDEDESTGKLKPSALGRLVYDAKYGDNNKKPRERIGQAMCEFIERHPLYGQADFIAAAPSHNAGRATGLSGRLVRQIADVLNLRVVPIERAVARDSQKTIIDPDRAKGVRARVSNQRHSMSVSDDLRGARVVLVDDLYGSGATLAEAARALKDASAKSVLGLTATKQRLFGAVRAG